MNKSLHPINFIVLFVVMCVVVAIGITYLLPDQSSGIVYTEYDIILIDGDAVLDAVNK